MVDGSFGDHEHKAFKPYGLAIIQGQEDLANVDSLAVIEKVEARLLLGPGGFYFLNLGHQVPRFVVNQDERGSAGGHVVNHPGSVPGGGGRVNKAGVIRGNME